MTRLDPDLDQAQQQLDERRALLPLAPAEHVGQVRRQIATLEAGQQPAQGGSE